MYGDVGLLFILSERNNIPWIGLGVRRIVRGHLKVTKK